MFINLFVTFPKGKFKLKRITFTLYFTLLISFASNTISMPDDSLLRHYPLNVGNLWDYSGGVTQIGTFYPSWILKSSVGDSVYADGETYKIVEIVSYHMNGRQKPGSLGSVTKTTLLQRIDSTSFNVYQIHQNSTNMIYLIDSLRANIGDEFKIYPGDVNNILSLIDTSTIDVFGGERKLRHLMIINPLVGFEFETVEGFGEFSWSSGGEGEPISRHLSGAIIKGDTLGSLLRYLRPGLALSHSEINFSKDFISQILFFKNFGTGMMIIDSVKVNDESKFFSQPGYRSGIYSNAFFSKGPFLVFPNDSIRLELFVREDALNSMLVDTLTVFSRGINGEQLPTISLPIHFLNETSVTEEDKIPIDFFLSQNYPNPFNPSTIIVFRLPKGSLVNLYVYNLLGEKIDTMVQGFLPEGTHKIKWDASDLAAGIYYYQIIAGEFKQTKKMSLMK